MYDFFEKMKRKMPWLFGSHYGIERFGVTFCVLAVLMSMCVGSILVKHGNDKKEQLGNQAMYTTRFRMSLSGAQGDVVSVHTSNDRTKCLLLLHYDDPTRMATNASDYSLFLTATTPSMARKELESSPEGAVYVFGNSGYLAVYLVDMAGFPSQILDLTIRSNNPYIDSEGPYLSERDDGSFSKNDQGRIYFNPGATESRTVSCLESEELTPYAIYESVLVQAEEQEIRDGMDAALQKLNQARAHIDAAEKTVTDRGLQVPEAPWQIAGDTVYVDEDGTLRYEPARLLPGSHAFDWRGGSVEQGYLAGILADGGYKSESEYFAEKAKELRENPEPFRVNVDWYTLEGDKVEVAATGSSKAEELTANAVSALTGAWQEFYAAKQEYLVTLPGRLLDLEVESREVTSNYTVRTGDGTLYKY